jgi:peptidylprolyl isomerase
MAPGLFRVLFTVALLALAPVACGGDEEVQQETETTETSAAAAAEALEDTTVKPEIPIPAGSPPRGLEKEDIVKGKGPAARAGDNVVVHYVGVSFSTGDEFDASWNTGQPFPFPLGGAQVIKGWDQGVVGMRKGGRRKLTIPPRLAYGAEGFPPAIGPNETLVFVVDLIEIQ